MPLKTEPEGIFDKATGELVTLHFNPGEECNTERHALAIGHEKRKLSWPAAFMRVAMAYDEEGPLAIQRLLCGHDFTTATNDYLPDGYAERVEAAIEEGRADAAKAGPQVITDDDAEAN